MKLKHKNCFCVNVINKEFKICLLFNAKFGWDTKLKRSHWADKFYSIYKFCNILFSYLRVHLELSQSSPSTKAPTKKLVTKKGNIDILLQATVAQWYQWSQFVMKWHFIYHVLHELRIYDWLKIQFGTWPYIVERLCCSRAQNSLKIYLFWNNLFSIV